MLNLRKAVMCGLAFLFSKISEMASNLRYITKDEYALTLREYQAACNGMKSDMREHWNISRRKA